MVSACIERSTPVSKGANATAHRVDLAQIASIPDAVAEVLRAHGRIDLLVNAAGISGDEGDILTHSEANWDRVLTINLKAPFRLIQEVGRHMVERGGGGRIVNVTSSSAHRARRSMAPYGAAKAGLAQLTRTAAADLGRHDINVNAVAYGFIETRLTQSKEKHHETIERHGKQVELGIPDQMRQMAPQFIPLGRSGSPDEAAGPVLFLASSLSDYVSGAVLLVTGGSYV